MLTAASQDAAPHAVLDSDPGTAFLIGSSRLRDHMHTPSRVAFSRFGTGDHPMLLAWGRFRARLELPTAGRTAAPARQQAPEPADRTIWRLFASNNREVARCARVYGSLQAAREHIAMAQTRIEALELHVVRGPESGSFGWVATLDGRSLVTCARWYPSSVCADAAAGALAQLEGASIADDWRWTHGIDRRAPEPAAWP